MGQEEQTNRVTLSVTLPPDLKVALQEIARAENNTVSRILENALRPWVENHPTFAAVAKSTSR